MKGRIKKEEIREPIKGKKEKKIENEKVKEDKIREERKEERNTEKKIRIMDKNKERTRQIENKKMK